MSERKQKLLNKFFIECARQGYLFHITVTKWFEKSIIDEADIEVLKKIIIRKCYNAINDIEDFIEQINSI